VPVTQSNTRTTGRCVPLQRDSSIQAGVSVTQSNTHMTCWCVRYTDTAAHILQVGVSLTQIQQHTYDRPMCPLHRDSSIHLTGRCARYTEQHTYDMLVCPLHRYSSTHITGRCVINTDTAAHIRQIDVFVIQNNNVTQYATHECLILKLFLDSVILKSNNKDMHSPVVTCISPVTYFCNNQNNNKIP